MKGADGHIDTSPLLANEASSVRVPTPSESHVSLAESSSSTEIVEHNKLTTLNGCYVPCLLNIMGIILFLRLGWAVGESGVSGVLLIFGVAETASLLTVLSLSALVTNGTMRGGGSYFMISRTLGPEFGGSIGVLFYFAYAVGITFYVTGFAEEIRNSFYPEQTDWFIAAVASGALFVNLLIALAGAAWFTKINVFLFLIQFAAILIGLFAMFFRPGGMLLPGANKKTYLFDGFKFENIGKNWEPSYNTDTGKCKGSCTFALVFSVVLPACTGIMEGANLSGDLSDPAYSIPVGTLCAVFTSIIFYLMLILAYAGSFQKETLLGSDTLMQQVSWSSGLVIAGVLVSSASSGLGALFGGSRVLQALARDEVFPGIKVFAQGTKKGDEPTNAVLFTWFIAQVCCLIFRGNLDAVANFIAALFCLSYAFVNLSAFFLEISGTPNFRPTWRIYSWHTCLAGVFINLGIMFYINWEFGLVASATEIVIFLLLVYRAPKMVWGEVTQSVIFHQVRKYLLVLDERKMHSKLWRPSILLLLHDVDQSLIDFCNQLKKGGLYIIGNTMVGDFQDLASTSHEIRREWINWIEQHQYKAFPQIAIGPDLRSCYQNLMLLAGLGAMSPNTIVIPQWTGSGETSGSLTLQRRNSVFKSIEAAKKIQLKKGAASVQKREWIECLSDVLVMRKNIVVTTNFEDLDHQLLGSSKLKESYQSGPGRGFGSEGEFDFSLDIWIQAVDYSWDMKNSAQDKGVPMLLLQLAHIICLNKKWAKVVKLRICLVVDKQDPDVILDSVQKFLKAARITCQKIEIFRAPTLKYTMSDLCSDYDLDEERVEGYKKYYTSLNSLIRDHSIRSLFTFIMLPELIPMAEDIDEKTIDQLSEIYIDSLQSLTKGLPPMALIATGEILPVISTDM